MWALEVLNHLQNCILGDGGGGYGGGDDGGGGGIGDGGVDQSDPQL